MKILKYLIIKTKIHVNHISLKISMLVTRVGHWFANILTQVNTFLKLKLDFSVKQMIV